MRPDAPAESGEGFKRSWSEAKEEAGWTEDGQGSGKRAGVSGPSSSWYLHATRVVALDWCHYVL